MLAYANGQTLLLNRDGPRGSIFVPTNSNTIDIWFSVNDDNLIPNQLTHNKIKFSSSLFNFSIQPEFNLDVTSNPILENGFYGSQLCEYYHRYSLDVSNYNPGEILFIKIYVKDDVNNITEIPTNGSEYQIVKYFSLEFII